MNKSSIQDKNIWQTYLLEMASISVGSSPLKQFNNSTGREYSATPVPLSRNFEGLLLQQMLGVIIEKAVDPVKPSMVKSNA